MRVLNEREYGLFERLVSMTQNGLLNGLSVYLKKKYKKVIIDKEYLVAIGDIPVALVAHLDTVFSNPVSCLYYDQRQGVMWSPNGLGADDRAGVFAIMNIIQSGLRPSIIFTTEEESGGLGAQALAKLPCPISDLKYLIQLDRQGDNDCVFYDCGTRSFIDYVSSFGFVEQMGTFSDISFLMPAWNICGVNLSIGYRDEHSVIETLNINSMFETIEKVKKMLAVSKEAPSFKYEEIKNYLTGWYKQYINTMDDSVIICDKCGQSYFDWEFVSVKDRKTGVRKLLCPECQIDYVGWCEECGQAYEIDCTKDDLGLCPDCLEALNV